MKKTVGIMVCLLLGGCYQPSSKIIEGPSPGTKYPQQDTAPLPWISILPSERARDLKEIDFALLAHQIRYDMSFDPDKILYRDICLVLIDYAILPPGISEQDTKVIMFEGKKYSKANEVLHQRYFMHLSFYKGNTRPPAAPDFEETIMMPTDQAAPQEAMQLLAREIMEDHHASPLKKIDVRLHI